MADRNTIARELTVEELDEFIRELVALPGKERTLAAIQAKAKARGIEISLMSASSFRKTTFANYLARVERRREFAERVAAVQSDARATLADAAAENLAEQVFDLTEELAEGEELDLKKAKTVSIIISKIRQGDVARSSLQLRIADYERKEKERIERDEKAKRELQKLRDPNAQLNETERNAILSAVDDLLGIRAPAAPKTA